MAPAKLHRLYGGCLLCLGCLFLYGSLDAIQAYFVSGHISWGQNVRRMTGEKALIVHGLFVLTGAWMAAEGLRKIVSGADKETLG